MRYKGGRDLQDDLKQLLKHHEEALREAWFAKMLESYPESGRKYFARKDKMFTNPVGANLAKSLGDLLHELLELEPNSERIMEHLTMILRIKVVQDVVPSQAVSFVPALKQLIERECQDAIRKGEVSSAELLDFYSDLDTVTLWAFDIYSESRDLIYELRLRQIKETNDILVKAQLLDQSLDMEEFMQCSTSIEGQECSCSGECHE